MLIIKSISPSIAKKVVTTNYLAKFQSKGHNSAESHWTGTKSKLDLYTHIPNIKSISQSIAKKSGRNCFIS